MSPADIVGNFIREKGWPFSLITVESFPSSGALIKGYWAEVVIHGWHFESGRTDETKAFAESKGIYVTFSFSSLLDSAFVSGMVAATIIEAGFLYSHSWLRIAEMRESSEFEYIVTVYGWTGDHVAEQILQSRVGPLVRLDFTAEEK